jgi:hypothetical protein
VDGRAAQFKVDYYRFDPAMNHHRIELLYGQYLLSSQTQGSCTIQANATEDVWPKLLLAWRSKVTLTSLRDGFFKKVPRPPGQMQMGSIK